MTWDDWRYYLALHRNGTLTAAARELEVNHATVGRRISSLEEDVGGVLFEPGANGWVLTALGEYVLDAALDAEETFLSLERTIQRADDGIRGLVRVATSRVLAMTFVIPAAADMREQLPEVQLDILEGVAFVSLPRREADIGVRLWMKGGVPGADSVRITHLGSITWGIFGSRELIRSHDIELPLASPGDLPFIGYDEKAPGHALEEWLEQGGTAPHLVMQANTLYTVLDGIERSIGFGVVPTVLGRAAGLVQVADETQKADVWLAIHPDLGDNARFRAVFDFLAEWFRERADSFV